MQLAVNVMLLISVAFILGLHVTIPAVSAFHENILFVFSEPIEVKVGLLFENMLTGCPVTESKCSRITEHLEFHTTRRRPISNH